MRTSACLRLLLCLTALAVAADTRADPVLELRGSVLAGETWRAVRALPDPAGTLTLDDVRRRAAEFRVPDVPANNFGPRTGALWIHVRLRPAGQTPHWVVEIDYPALNRIDAYVVAEDGTTRHLAMGNTVRAGDRPMRSRAHAAMVELEPGRPCDLFLRVQSTSTLVVPIRFHPADAFVSTESARLLLQGLLFGITLMLLATSLVNGLSLRDRVFGYYAMMIVGVSTFFVSFSGLGHQFLWPVQAGPLAKISPWGALLATAGASLFASGALELDRHRPRVARVLRVLALAGGLAILVSMLGLLDYRRTQLAATILGPIPIVLALRESLRQARAGSKVATYMALGWGAYTVGALSMASILRGWVPVDFWIQHLFQFASVAEMFAWMRVLSLRIEAVRRDAERTKAEKHALLSLAHTDPLTGLPNRRGLAAALEAAAPTAHVESALAVYLLDLDGFKAVNDRLGHDAGDALLVQVARRLRGVLRAADLIARLGGDEFVVMSQGVISEAAAMRIGLKMLEALREPFLIQGQVCRVGLTVGFAIAPHDGTEPGDLLRRADAAMYAGKQGGRNCVRRGAASAGLAAAS